MSHISSNEVCKSELGLRIYELTGYVKNSGATLELLTDFEDYRNFVEAYSDAGAVTAIVDSRITTIGPENGFWVKATNKNGKIIHTQAVRFDDLTGTTLSRHWQSDPVMYAPAWLDIDINKCDFDTASITHEITGAVCYHADFWLDKEYRNMELASLLSNFALLMALIRFSPDYMYGFIVPGLVKRGWAARSGYLHIHPWAPRWHIRKDAILHDEYIVWVTGQELAELWGSGKRNADVLC